MATLLEDGKKMVTDADSAIRDTIKEGKRDILKTVKKGKRIIRKTLN